MPKPKKIHHSPTSPVEEEVTKIRIKLPSGDRLYLGVVILLSVVAALLGWMIIGGKSLDDIKNLNSLLRLPGSQNELPADGPMSASYSAIRRPYPEGISEEEKLILDPVPQSANEEFRKQHYQTVVKLAKETTKISLNKCEKSDPLVARVKHLSEIEFVNNDSVEHSLTFDEAHQYTIPANESQKIKVEFKNGIGVHGYGCDSKVGVVGVLLVE